MNITVIGTGYVGLVTGACFAAAGNHVICVDTNVDKIRALNEGIIPIYEPGLEELVKTNIAEQRLQFITSLSEQQHTADIYFIAVGTPSDEDGTADLQYVLTAAADIGKHIKTYTIIVDKSTVPVYTSEKVETAIKKELEVRNLNIKFDVVSNPEFLKEGAAVSDFMRPDRIIVGTESERVKDMMRTLYAPYSRSHDCLIFMGRRDAEMTKYACNAILATKISFMNEIANLCERMQVDVENVRLGIGADSRIGYHFIYPGCGYGGSCFPKDIKALISMAKEYEYDTHILQAVEKRNQEQKKVLFNKLKQKFPEKNDLTVALWGLSFKPNTDDMREASSVAFLHDAISYGAKIQAYDPAAMKEAHRVLPAEWFTNGSLTLAEHQYDALKNADVLILATEWLCFRFPDFAAMKNLMRNYVIIDGRNQYNPTQVREAGFDYMGVGRV